MSGRTPAPALLLVAAASLCLGGVQGSLLTPQALTKAGRSAAPRPSAFGGRPFKPEVELRGGNAAVTAAASHIESATGFNLGAFKILLVSGLTLLNIACWATPLLTLKTFRRDSAFLTLGSCFSGGVFLALSMGHLIPEAIENIHEQGMPASVALWCALAGYLAVLVVDKVAFDTHSLEHGHAHDHSPGHDHSDEIVLQTSTATPPSGSGSSVMGAFVLLGALCVHSLFEALALGVCTTKTAATMLSASIGLHQPAETLALLVALLKSGMGRRAVVEMMALFTLIQPIGCSLGMMAKNLDMPFLDSALAAVAAGTFIYVGANEVVAEEFEGVPAGPRWRRFGSFMVGIGAIAGLAWATERWHGHAHHH